MNKKEMKKMIKLGLLLALTIFKINLVSAAEQEVRKIDFSSRQERLLQVTSLQMLALKYIEKGMSENNERLMDSFKISLKENSIIKIIFEKNMSRRLLQLALIECNKSTEDRKSPLEVYEKMSPILSFLISKRELDYSLSFRDLIESGVDIRKCIKEYSYEKYVLYLNNLSLTSLDGLQDVLFDSRIKVLHLQNNNFKVLTRGIFATLGSLERLDLYNAGLERIEVGVFADLPYLKMIDALSNKFTLEARSELLSLTARN